MSSSGTFSSGMPAFFQAARPPRMMRASKPWERRMCATRALVESFSQVQ